MKYCVAIIHEFIIETFVTLSAIVILVIIYTLLFIDYDTIFTFYLLITIRTYKTFHKLAVYM